MHSLLRNSLSNGLTANLLRNPGLLMPRQRVIKAVQTRTFVTTRTSYEPAKRATAKSKTETSKKASAKSTKAGTTTKASEKSNAGKTKKVSAKASTTTKAKKFKEPKSVRIVGKPKGVKTKKKILPAELQPPKRPVGAFVRFRAEVCQGKTTKQSVEEWNLLSDAEKQAYKDRMHKEQSQYKKDLQKWVDSVHPDVIRKAKVTLKRSDGMSRPTGAFFTFLREFREKYKGDSDLHPMKRTVQITTEAGKTWRAMSEQEKGVYKNLHNNDAAKYQAHINDLGLKNLEPSNAQL